VLKKYMVAPIMALNIRPCKLAEAITVTDTNIADLTRMATISETINRPYTET